MRHSKIFFISIFASYLFSSGIFTLENQNINDVEAHINFNIGTISFEEQDGFHKIKTDSKGKIDKAGEPELPTYSFNYAVNKNREYNVSYNVIDYEIIENIDIYPSQPVIKSEKLEKKIELYDSENLYPENNLNLNRMSLRGYEMLNVQIIPFEYNFSNKTLKIYTSVEIIISESEFRDNDSNILRSEKFENMYKNVIINSDSYEDSRSFQKPSILYIMEDYNAVIESLVEWRRQQGYVVTVVDKDQTGSSTTSIRNYIENAYDNWDNPPEFVCLVGDANGSLAIPTFTVGGGGGWSAAYAESDLPFSLVDGDDNLPDVFMGRMSVRSITELTTVINKIIGYEKNYSGATDWLNAAALVGDPYDSGISTVITNEYIEQIIDIHGGITDVRTKYSGGNFDGWMRDQMDDGVSFLNYRGFYGFSNFSHSDVDALNNGYKLPFFMTLTCGVGSFEDDNECMTEALFRAGTAVNPKGAVAVIGTAQSYTHTAFNNIVTMGMYEGLFINGAGTAGETLQYGQLALYEIYPQNPNNNSYYFSAWNNLMGDPATQIWTSTPIEVIIDHSPSINHGSNNFQVNVSDVDNNALENIKVTLYKNTGGEIEIQQTSVTNENGVADFILDSYFTSGDVKVLAHCQNCMPTETEFEISDSPSEIVINEDSINLNDEWGNNDGYFNPSETVDVSFEIINLSFVEVDNLTLDVSTNSNMIAVENGNMTIGDIGPGGVIDVSGVMFTAASNMHDDMDPEIRMNVYSESDDYNWYFVFPLDFLSGDFLVEPNIVSDGNNNGMLDRGEEATLNLIVDNIGSIPLEGLSVEIDYDGSFLLFDNNFLDWSDISIGESQYSTTFNIEVNQNVVNGSIISIPLYFSTDNGYQSSQMMHLQVGEVSVTDPLGPDSYGYYIYDMGDLEYEFAPTYDWIEIDPDLGGDGQYVNVDDDGNNDDAVTTVDLPFTFTFYGVDYDRLSICSNGWISFGDTDMRSFRNYTLPGPGGPSPIVAVFWDDLKTVSGGEVYSYYDASDDLFIVEWSDVRTYYNNSTETFQVILYNTGWQTHTGDDEIKIQFKDFNNTSVGDYPVGNYNGAVVHGQYCTVGIENHLSSDGLQYTYNNSYPEAAAPLSDYSALFISTRNAALSAIPELAYSNDNFSFELDEDDQSTDQLILENVGEPGSVLYYDLDVAPFASAAEQTDDFGYAWAQSFIDENVNYNWIDIEDDNETLIFDTNDGGAIIDLGFNFPFYGTSYGLCVAMANGWIAFDGTSEEWNNGSIFDDDSPRAAILAFWDDLNPVNEENDFGSGHVRYNANDERVVIWYDNVIHWTDYERVYDFQIVLYQDGKIDINYRDMEGTTGSATVGIIDNDGDYGLEVVYNVDDFIQDQMSVSFDTAPDWLQLTPDNFSGEILSGETAEYNLLVNSSDVLNGTYTAYIVINTNATVGSTFIPVDLIVGNLILGDINQDGIFNVLDVVTLVGIIMGNVSPDETELLLSDLNQDGMIDVLDVVNLVNLVLDQ